MKFYFSLIRKSNWKIVVKEEEFWLVIDLDGWFYNNCSGKGIIDGIK